MMNDIYNVKDFDFVFDFSAGVPGTVNGLIKIFNDYGSGNFTLAEIIQPAINLAEKGFPLEENAAHGFDTNKKYFIKDSGSHAIFVKNTNNEVDFLNQFPTVPKSFLTTVLPLKLLFIDSSTIIPSKTVFSVVEEFSSESFESFVSNKSTFISL